MEIKLTGNKQLALAA